MLNKYENDDMEKPFFVKRCRAVSDAVDIITVAVQLTESSVIEDDGSTRISFALGSSGEPGRMAMKQGIADRSVEADMWRMECGDILRTNSGEAGMCVDYDASEQSANPS
jgi:hypothetical protein